MKKLYFLSLLYIFLNSAFSQNTIILSFAGKNALTQNALALDSVVIKNLTQNCETTLYNSFSYFEVNAIWPEGLNEICANTSDGFGVNQNYPNPFYGSTNVSIYKEYDGPMNLLLSDGSGRKLAEYQDEFDKGYHSFSISTSGYGILILTVSDEKYSKSIKVISAGESQAKDAILYFGQKPFTDKIILKSRESSDFVFYMGDQLSYTAYANGFDPKSILDSPANDITYTFNLSPAVPVQPSLTTATIENITQTTATCGGNITNEGNITITSRGVCWSISASPTITDSKTEDGSGTGTFSSLLSNLTLNTSYYVRAYITTSAGTVYGNELSFKTNTDKVPIYSLFKVIDGKKFSSIIKTIDGGFVGIVFTDDYNIIKFDSEFNIAWDKTYGGSKGDYAQSIIQTNDGGYLVIGYTLSSDGDITSSRGESDIWICKLDAMGNLLWNRNYGGFGSESLSGENSVLQTSDGGYIFSATTNSSNIDVSANHGEDDIWVVKISSIGNIKFQKTYGGSSSDYGRNLVINTAGYALLGKSGSVDGDFNEAGNWVIQLDLSGNILWKTNLYGVNPGFINATNDGGLVAVNTSFTDFSLNKLSSEGNINLTKTISFQSTTNKQPDAIKIMQSTDGGFFVIGTLGNGSAADALLFRVSPNFSLRYKQIYNGNNWDMSSSFIAISADTYLYQFMTYSTDLPNVSNPAYEASVIIKLEEK